MWFTKKEDRFIKENINTVPLKRIAKMLGRAEGSIYGRVNRLNLKRDRWIVEKFRKESQFKKGQTPINKGKKQTEFISPEGLKRVRKTQFKKGITPPNTLYDGCIVIRNDKTKVKYKWIRVSKAKWKMLHVYNWEKVYGRIPANHIIVFKNKDTMNCEVDNLEMITRKENMARNTIHRYPVEIKSAIRAVKKLSKTIEEYGT